jgi:hypothetical protein
MALNALYSKYFQKSKIFLYPLLDIKRGSIVPSETYLGWADNYNPDNMKLICVYKPQETDFYNDFEVETLLKHTRLCDFIKVDSDTSVFIFDFSDYKNDWTFFITGKYSKISDELKRKILNYFDKKSGNYTYVESYLFPEKYVKKYAEILDVPVDLLLSVGELCDKPNLEKEMLLLEVANLENIKILN